MFETSALSIVNFSIKFRLSSVYAIIFAPSPVSNRSDRVIFADGTFSAADKLAFGGLSSFEHAIAWISEATFGSLAWAILIIPQGSAILIAMVLISPLLEDG
jgi:hypothetical protein